MSTEVLFHLGEFPHPVSGEKKKDLFLAKHVIDTLSMLKEKTQGNLTEEEQKLMEGMLYDLRMAFSGQNKIRCKAQGTRCKVFP